MKKYQQEEYSLAESAKAIEKQSKKQRAFRYTKVIVLGLLALTLNVIALVLSSCRREPWHWRSYGFW